MFSEDSMAHSDGKQFSTRDRNNGVNGVSCAEERGGGGWWYWFCTHANLNGVYHHSPSATDYTGIWWWFWHGGLYSLKATTMMVRKTGERQDIISSEIFLVKD